MIDKLFHKPTDNIFIQMFRYVFVGGTAFAVDFFFLYFFSDICGIYYLISGVLSFIISVLVNYWMSTVWVFNQDNIDNKLLEFNLFLAISTIGLVFTEILLWLFTDVCGLHYLISKIIAAAIVMFWNFIARRVMFYGKDLF
ncbi:MAG: GtrA family protein [Methanobrevibacter sp.]|uniref:GtrA family protein n=1 Tax=Methanobrevibacter sp. TaxID=66852 RepID=UPI002E781185|nr:GtrA family protein [Methanobrevibacter sp.]MEE0935621.1 GtrA family protein [Methanobrevibacter sp.]